MARIEPVELQVPYDTDMKCPACEQRIPIIATVRIKDGSVRKTGSSGFMHPNFSATMDVKVLGFKIEHSCLVRTKED